MYNKLFTKILDSSIWMEDDATRIVWITIIAAMDEDGFVQFASVSNLAYRARVTVEAAELAASRLESPDPNSADPDYEGRRIERVNGGWIVLNADKYRKLVTRAIEREQTRMRVAKHRAKSKHGNGTVTVCNETVTPSEAVSGAVAGSVSEPKTTPIVPALPASPGVSEKRIQKTTLPESAEAKRIAQLFSRRLTTEWSVSEIKAFKTLKFEPSDLDLIEAYYAAQRDKGEEGRHRRDLKTFLNNFPGELDRARQVQKKVIRGSV